MWLNAMPAEQGISRKYSPQDIVTQHELNFTKDCKAVFGSYVKASEDASVINDMTAQTHACIALGPAGNIQGSQKCFDITTGLLVNQHVIHELSMLKCIIKKMNWWGSKNNGEEYENKLQFLNRNKEKFNWDNDEVSNNDELVEEASMTHAILLAELPGIVEENDFSDDDVPVQELRLVDNSILAANANLTKSQECNMRLQE